MLRISGRIAQDDVEILRAAIDQEQGAMVIDLEEISVVDRSAVDLLALSVARGVTLRNCPGTSESGSRAKKGSHDVLSNLLLSTKTGLKSFLRVRRRCS